MGNIASCVLMDIPSENNRLKKEILKLNKKIIALEKMKNNSGIDSESMDAFEKNMKKSVNIMVDDMLKNDSINSRMIPDYIEKKIYTNIFTVIIGLLKEVLEDTSINLLNQSITLKMTPR